MLSETESYNELVCSSCASLARISDPRIASRAEEDSSIIAQFFEPSKILLTSTITHLSQDTANRTKIYIVLDFRQQDFDMSNKDEFCFFLRETTTADVDKDSLQWWLVNY